MDIRGSEEEKGDLRERMDVRRIFDLLQVYDERDFLTLTRDQVKLLEALVRELIIAYDRGYIRLPVVKKKILEGPNGGWYYISPISGNKVYLSPSKGHVRRCVKNELEGVLGGSCVPEDSERFEKGRRYQ